jgi:hypothetical protein
MLQRTIVYSLLCTLLFACKPEQKHKTATTKKDGATYFSITQFVLDQWNTFHGQPYGMEKVVEIDGKTDSTLLNAYTMDWGPVFKVFFETDISDPKFLDHYRFSMFEDNATTTRNFYYEAIDDDLFTRKLQISADEFSDKIKSVYIETEKKGRSGVVTQKLLYLPMKTISIQEFEWSTGNKPKDMRVVYRFL